MARVLPYRARQRPWLAPAGVFAVTFAAALYALTPDAPGKAEMREEWTKRTSDQRYGGCDDARRNNHENIGRWEPSYRPQMDADGDGLACEPWRGPHFKK